MNIDNSGAGWGKPKEDDSKTHFYMSLVKSVFRFGAGAALIAGSLHWAGILIIIAEVWGVFEEL